MAHKQVSRASNVFGLAATAALLGSNRGTGTAVVGAVLGLVAGVIREAIDEHQEDEAERMRTQNHLQSERTMRALQKHIDDSAEDRRRQEEKIDDLLKEISEDTKRNLQTHKQFLSSLQQAINAGYEVNVTINKEGHSVQNSSLSIREVDRRNRLHITDVEERPESTVPLTAAMKTKKIVKMNLEAIIIGIFAVCLFYYLCI